MSKKRFIRVVVLLSLSIAVVLTVALTHGQRVLPPPGEPADETNSPALIDFEPYQIVVFEPNTQESSSWASAASIASRVNAQLVSNWTDVEQIDSTSPINALIVNAPALEGINQEWLLNAYWNRGLIVVGVNIDGPEFSSLIGRGQCHANHVAENWRSNDFYIIKSRLVLAAIDAERAAKILYNRKNCGNDGEAQAPFALGYITESEHTYVSPLVSESDLHLFARFLLNDLLSVERKREGFARGELGQAVTPEVFRQRMASIGMSGESIERVIEAMQ